MPATDSDTGALRTEFQAIATTITLVTAANNSGHPTLIPLHGDGPAPSFHSMDRQSRTGEIMKSIASLLVRKREVVAVTCVQPQPGEDSDWSEFVVIAEDAPGRNLDGEGDDGVVNGGNITGKYPTITKCPSPSSFPAFNNASQNGSHVNDSKHLVRLVESGQPRWTAISQLQTPDILDPDKL